MGNQLNMSFEYVAGTIESDSSPKSCVSKYPLNP